MIRVYIISKYAIFAFALLHLLNRCKKDPPIVTGINAGDSTSKGIIYINLHNAVANGNIYASAFIKMDNDVYISFSTLENLTSENHTFYSSIYAYQVNVLSPIAYIYTDKMDYPIAMNYGANINNTLNWNGKPNNALIMTTENQQEHIQRYGNWGIVQEGYLGYKVVRGKTTYLGWVRLGIGQNFIIKSYAYMKF